jgi:hypothetical protein
MVEVRAPCWQSTAFAAGLALCALQGNQNGFILKRYSTEGQASVNSLRKSRRNHATGPELLLNGLVRARPAGFEGRIRRQHSEIDQPDYPVQGDISQIEPRMELVTLSICVRG